MLLSLLTRAQSSSRQPTSGGGLYPVFGNRIGRQWWPQLTEESLLQVTVAQACVSLLSDQIATAPMYVQRPDGSRAEPPAWLAQPDPEQSCCDTVTQLVVSLLTAGNAYAVITSRGAGAMPTSIKVLSPTDVVLSRWQDSHRLRYQVCGSYVPLQDMIHVRGLTLGGYDIGVGPVSYGARLMGIAGREADYAALRFDQSGNGAAIPDYFIESDQPISSEQAKRVGRQLQAKAGGLQRGPLVLDAGMKARRIEFTAEELELIVSRKFTDTQICSMFGVPPHLVAVQTENSMTYSNVRDDMTALVALQLKPWGRRISTGLSPHLLPAGHMLGFDFSELTRDLSMPPTEDTDQMQTTTDEQE